MATPDQLPSGKFAEYIWDGLSYSMRDILLQVKEVGETRLLWTKGQTLNALIKRGLADGITHQLTEDGKALVEWMKDKERNT